MKRFAKFMLIMAVLAAAFAFAACETVVSVEIEKGNEPQLTYVLGQELNLSGGKLTVRNKDGKKEVPLNDPSVSVSGYDKTLTGKQELAVEYKGKTAKLTVTVNERLAPEGVVREFFVGEPFDAGKGKLRVTRDDGTVFTVPLNDERVELTGFDSAKSGTVPLNVRYRDGAEDYSGSFDVEVYGIEKISLQKPRKTIYGSHETEIDLSGGYLTIEGNGGALKRYVTLTQEMISGFDPSLATMKNRTEPLKQTISVNYAGNSQTYEISVNYSDVSVILEYAEELSSLDFGSGVPAVSAEQTDRALEAAELYLGLAQAEKEFIPQERAECVMRAAAAGGRSRWKEAVAEYSSVFTPVNGKARLTESSYEEVKERAKTLADADFAPLGDTLLEIAAAFPDAKMYGSVTVGSYLGGAFGTRECKSVIAKLELMTKLYETLLPIPDGWTQEDLTAHEQEIKNAASYVTNSAYPDISERYFYGVASSWRKNNDIFDILYTYYYVMKQDVSVTNRLIRYQLPGEAEAYYVAANQAMSQLNGMGRLEVSDNTLFRLYYAQAVEAYAAVTEKNSELQLLLLKALGLDTAVSQLESSMGQIAQNVYVGGYYFQQYAMLGDDVHTALWHDYLAIVDGTLYQDGYAGSEEYAGDVEALFRKFVEASPAHQFSFLISLNTLYFYGEPLLALDLTETKSYFARLLTEVYGNALAPAAREIFSSLLIAMEYYARYDADSSAPAGFEEAMEAAETGYSALTPDEKASFDGKLLFLLEKYRTAREDLKKTAAIPADWQADFDALKTAMVHIASAYGKLQQGQNAAAALLASFEKGEELVRKITQSGNAAALTAFTRGACGLYTNYPQWTWDYCWMNMRYQAVSFLTGQKITVQGDAASLVWESYSGSALRGFLAKAESLIWSTLGETAQFGKEEVLALMKEFRGLDAGSRCLLIALDGQRGLYYSALETYFKGLFSEGWASTVAQSLFALERAYAAYEYHPAKDTAEAVKTALTNCKNYYGRLSSERTKFDGALGEYYTYYTELCASVGNETA